MDIKGKDSLLFEIFVSIPVDPGAVALAGGEDDTIRINLPKPNDPELEHSRIRDELFLNGGARRGLSGIRVESPDYHNITSIEQITKSFKTDEEGQRVECGETKLTYRGDSGAIYFCERGIPRYMHTKFKPLVDPEADRIKGWVSRAVSLQAVVNVYPNVFSDIPGLAVSTMSSSFQNQGLSSPVDVNVAVTEFQYPQGWTGTYPLFA
jgi:hypothetical protein